MARRVVLPESKIKRRRRVRRTRLAIVIGVGLVLLIGIAIGLAWIPYIRIKEVDAVGMETISTSTLEQFAQDKISGRSLFVIPKDNIFLYPKKAIEAGLIQQFPEIKSVKVSAENFQAIKIQVVERHATAVWCPGSLDAMGGEGHDCLLVDQTGLGYAGGAVGANGLVTYYGTMATSGLPSQYLDSTQYATLVSLVAALSQNQSAYPVTAVEVDANLDVHAQFANGFILLFALADAGKDVYQRFTLALASQPFLTKTTADFQYLDLRFGDKLYYKPK